MFGGVRVRHVVGPIRRKVHAMSGARPLFVLAGHCHDTAGAEGPDIRILERIPHDGRRVVERRATGFSGAEILMVLVVAVSCLVGHAEQHLRLNRVPIRPGGVVRLVENTASLTRLAVRIGGSVIEHDTQHAGTAR